jgi:hypothetical protein
MLKMQHVEKNSESKATTTNVASLGHHSTRSILFPTAISLRFLGICPDCCPQIAQPQLPSASKIRTEQCRRERKPGENTNGTNQ